MTYSDHEDIWMLEQFPADYLGWAADIGAYDGFASNTLALERRGWKVLCVEPNPALARKCATHRALTVAGACDATGSAEADFHIYTPAPGCYSSLRPSAHVDDPGWCTVPVETFTLEYLLAWHTFPRLDALSIDTEGTELDVLRGLDLERWQPRCLVVESWAPNSPTVIAYLAEHSYECVGRRTDNDLFVRRA